jgi:hypothetical protein
MSVTGGYMTVTADPQAGPDHRDRISFARLLWVAPLTVAVALAVNLALKAIVVALDPSLAEMGQLGRPMIILTLEGAVLAVIVFALIAWLVPRPIFWYRVVGIIALLVSLIPDVLLGLGGDSRRMGSAMVGPFLRFGALLFPSGPPPGGGRPGGGPSGPPPALPLEQVLVLMLLHAATAVVCIVLLTTLTRTPDPVGRTGE